MTLQSADWTKIYTNAVFLRSFEYVSAQEYDAGRIPGLLHLAIGQEVLAALLGVLIDPMRDRLTTSHRCHAMALALGVAPDKVAHELMGLPTGLSAGRGGTQHLIGDSGPFMASNGIVGAPLPLALGAALAAKHQNTGGIAVCVIGDGAFNQGVVSESLNLASAQRLPLLIIVDNNGKAQDTDTAHVTSGQIVTRARAYGMAAEKIDSQSPRQLADCLARLIDFTRESHVPTLLEVTRPDIAGHYHGHGNIALPPLRDLPHSDLSDPLAALAYLAISEDPEILSHHDALIADAEERAAHCFDKLGPTTEGQP